MPMNLMESARIFIGGLLCCCAACCAESLDVPVAVWRPETLRLVAPDGCYGRMIRLADGDMLCCYQYRRQSWVRRSADSGRSWDDGVRVTAYDRGIAANPELIQLASGRILLCYNERPDVAEAHYTICVVHSDDNGRTWGVRRQLFEAGTLRRIGCWEPAPLQYPDGEIQIFFANEAPYPYSNDQEISVLRSTDNGASWQGPKTVAYRSDARDGMPVPLLLADGRTVVLAIEDSALDGPMKPVILRDSVEKRWLQTVIKGNSPMRESALLQPLPTDVYAGAPYLCRLPSGVTLLSVQSRERRPYEEPAVYVGDADARNFTNRTFPLPLDPGIEGSWNSLFVKDENTVTLLSTTKINGRSGIWAIDGTVGSRGTSER